MDKEKYLEDLKEIREMMQRSSRFISLSGMSGIATGLTALTGASVAYFTVFSRHDLLHHHASEISNTTLWLLLLIASATLLLSLAAATLFTIRKTKQKQLPVWDMQTKRLLANLLIPLSAGGILCLMLLFKGYAGMLPPLTLIFYGLALINGSHFTLPEIRNLGLIQVLLGLLAFQFISYGLFFWMAGFGVVQIIYGLMIQRKY